METAAEKQRYLEPIIQRVSRAAEKHRGELIFLLLVCEPVRRGVSGEPLSARTGLEGPTAAPAAHRREEARRVQEIERERLIDFTRQAVLEAIYRYPAADPPRPLTDAGERIEASFVDRPPTVHQNPRKGSESSEGTVASQA